jgi:hypothetical protein
MMMGNGSHASIHGVGTLDLNLTLGRIMQHVPTINKNLVSVSFLCRNTFKVCLSQINLSCLSVDNLSVMYMSVEVCSAFLFLISTISS